MKELYTNCIFTQFDCTVSVGTFYQGNTRGNLSESISVQL